MPGPYPTWGCFLFLWKKNRFLVDNTSRNYHQRGQPPQPAISDSASMKGFSPRTGGFVFIKPSNWIHGSHTIWVFPKIGVAQNGWWKLWKTLLNWMIWGENPLFSETSILRPAPGSDIFPDPELKGLKVSGEKIGRAATTPTLGSLAFFTTSPSGSLLSLKGFKASSKGFPGATGAEGTVPPGLTFEIHAKIFGKKQWKWCWHHWT